MYRPIRGRPSPWLHPQSNEQCLPVSAGLRSTSDRLKAMIVRINQFEAHRAAEQVGWPTAPLVGEFGYDWPIDTHAFEILILESDEQNHRLAQSFRQKQLRQLLPEIVATFRDAGEAIVVRLDGLMLRNELIHAMWHLTDDGQGRFAVSEVAKFESSPLPIYGSVRIHASPQRLAGICADSSLGLERSVRLRVICAPLAMVNPLLDTSDLEDERWAQTLPRASFVLSTTPNMQSLHLLTRRFDPVETRTRLMDRLLKT
jgi:hypothetical protein